MAVGVTDHCCVDLLRLASDLDCCIVGVQHAVRVRLFDDDGVVVGSTLHLLWWLEGDGVGSILKHEEWWELIFCSVHRVNVDFRDVIAFRIDDGWKLVRDDITNCNSKGCF